MPKFFNSKSKQLEGDIDGFLDRVTTAGLIFQEGVKAYVKASQSTFSDLHVTFDTKRIKGAGPGVHYVLFMQILRVSGVSFCNNRQSCE